MQHLKGLRTFYSFVTRPPTCKEHSIVPHVHGINTTLYHNSTKEYFICVKLTDSKRVICKALANYIVSI